MVKISASAENPLGVIRFYEFATRNVSTIAEIPRSVIVSATGFDAAPDGSIVVWSQLDRNVHDLMLLERFR